MMESILHIESIYFKVKHDTGKEMRSLINHSRKKVSYHNRGAAKRLTCAKRTTEERSRLGEERETRRRALYPAWKAGRQSFLD